MSYYFTKKVNLTFQDAISKVKDELKKEGFGVLTEIDVKETLKNKINVDFYNYKILGACNPTFAYKALSLEDKLGTMLPCNFIVQEKEKDLVEVSVINPLVSMQSVQNENLESIANEIHLKLKRIIENI